MLDFETWNQIRKLLCFSKTTSRKLRHFSFSQCFILSTSPHCSLPCNVFLLIVTLWEVFGVDAKVWPYQNRNKKVTWSNSHEVIKLLQRKCTLQEKRFDCECLSYVSYVVQWWISLFTQSPDSRPYCELFFSIIFVSFNHESILHYSGYFSPSKRRDKKDRELYEGKTTAIYH